MSSGCPGDQYLPAGIIMPSQKNNILQITLYMKSDKIPYIIYADVEYLDRKIDGCANKIKKINIVSIVGKIV